MYKDLTCWCFFLHWDSKKDLTTKGGGVSSKVVLLHPIPLPPNFVQIFTIFFCCCHCFLKKLLD